MIYCLKLAAKYGTPYFANCIATNRRPIDLRESFDNEFKEDILINKSGGLLPMEKIPVILVQSRSICLELHIYRKIKRISFKN